MAVDFAKYSKPNSERKERIFYSEEMWKLLGEAMSMEYIAAPANMTISVVALANQAQKNQTKFLLGDDYGRAEWPTREFTAIVQLDKAVKYMHECTLGVEARALDADRLEVVNKSQEQQLSSLLATSAQTIREMQAQIDALKAKNAELETRRPPLSAYDNKEVVQAYHAIMFNQYVAAEELILAAAVHKEESEKITAQLELSTKQLDANNSMLAEVVPVMAAVKEGLALRYAVIQNDLVPKIAPQVAPASRQGKEKHRHHSR